MSPKRMPYGSWVSLFPMQIQNTFEFDMFLWR